MKLLAVLLTSAILVVASPNPLASRSQWVQTFYASDDRSGDPIFVLDDTKSGCHTLPSTAYSLSLTGSSCCGAYMMPAHNGWTCANGLEKGVGWTGGEIECQEFPEGVKLAYTACC